MYYLVSNKISGIELAKIKSELSVHVSIRTKPESIYMNSALLGVLTLFTGNVTNSFSGGDVTNHVIMTYQKFYKLYRGIILPSVSDRGSVSAKMSGKAFHLTFGNCNNITRILTKSADLTNIANINIGIEIVIPLSDYSLRNRNLLLREISEELQ